MITQERLKENVVYNKDTGVFRWVPDIVKNGVAPNSIAGSKSTNGYLRIMIDYKEHLSHRLAWLYVHGYLPENYIDHINRVRDDNRIENLRESSGQCNQRNRGVSLNNTSGITGVTFYSNSKKWVAYLKVNNKRVFLGQFNKKINAAIARYNGEIKYEFNICCNDSSALRYIRSFDTSTNPE